MNNGIWIVSINVENWSIDNTANIGAVTSLLDFNLLDFKRLGKYKGKYTSLIFIQG